GPNDLNGPARPAGAADGAPDATPAKPEEAKADPYGTAPETGHKVSPVKTEPTDVLPISPGAWPGPLVAPPTLATRLPGNLPAAPLPSIDFFARWTSFSISGKKALLVAAKD